MQKDAAVHKFCATARPRDCRTYSLSGKMLSSQLMHGSCRQCYAHGFIKFRADFRRAIGDLRWVS